MLIITKMIVGITMCYWRPMHQDSILGNSCYVGLQLGSNSRTLDYQANIQR